MPAVGVGLPNPSIWELPDPNSIREQNVFLAVCKLYRLNSCFFYSLDGPIWEDAFLLPISKDALDRPIREDYLLRAVREVLLDLTICEFKHLQPIREGGLGGLSLSEVVNHFLIGVSLLDVVVVEVDNGVLVWEHLPFDPIVKDHLVFAIFIHPLDLPIIAYLLLNYLHVRHTLVVVLRLKFHLEIFLLSHLRFLFFSLPIHSTVNLNVLSLIQVLLALVLVILF